MGLIHIFGEVPSSKILDFFRLQCYWDYSIKDISKETGLSYSTVQKTLPRLLKIGVIKYNRTEGKATLYIFNKESEMAKHIQSLAVLEDASSFQSGSHKKSLP